MMVKTSQVARSTVDADAQRLRVLQTVRANSNREKGLVDCSGTRKEGRKCFIKKSQCMTWWAV